MLVRLLMKCAIFVSRQTIAIVASQFLLNGRKKMKSIEMYVQGASARDNGCRGPVEA